MTPIKRNLLYIFRGDLLRLRITWPSQSLTLSVGYHVDRDKWDGQRCRRNSTHGPKKVNAAVINKVLENLENDIDRAFYTFDMANDIPSPDDIKNHITGSSKNNKFPTVAELLPKYMAEQSVLRQWSDNTIRMTKRSINILMVAFGQNVTLDDIDESAIVKLLNFMTTKECPTSPHSERGMNNNSINHYMAFIGTFARWAIENGYCRDTVVAKKNRQLKTAKRPVVFLTLDEVNKFRASASTDTQKEVAEIFTFCCFTGLRFSDVMALKWSQVKDSYIEVVTKKTHDLIQIEFNDCSREIINRRSRSNDDDLVFKSYNNSDYNKLTKLIAKNAGIDSPVSLTTYVGNERQTVSLPKWNFVTFPHTPQDFCVPGRVPRHSSPGGDEMDGS